MSLSRRLPRRLRQQREAWAREALRLAQGALDTPALPVSPPSGSAGAPHHERGEAEPQLPVMTDAEFLWSLANEPNRMREAQPSPPP